MPLCCIIVPIHDREKNIQPLLDSLSDFLRPKVELLLIDDGSTDGSWEAIKQACRAPWVRGLRLDRNRGQQSALLAGLSACRNMNVITLDDDLSHPATFIPELLAALEKGHDLVYADPPKRPGNYLRRTASRLHQYHLAFLTGSSLKIRVGSFRAISFTLVDRILDQPEAWPYLSALALGLRPKPRMSMLPSPAWKTGSTGQFPLGRLLRLELLLTLHHGHIPRLHRRITEKKKPDSTAMGMVSESWIIEDLAAERTEL